MPFKDTLKKIAHWTAAVSSAVTMQSVSASPEPDNVQKNAPLSSVSRQATEYLDYRVRRGLMVNGKTQTERTEKWERLKKEKGPEATLKAIRQEKIEKIEIPHKDEKGYLFETYEPGKKHTFESYYPNGVLQAKSGENGQAAVGFYPDGSKKFERTVDGIETHYHAGGQKGKEKIKETPHGLLDAYDVLDEEGRRTEHHYAVAESPEYKTSNGTYTSRDVKKVDLYNPQTQKIIGTYTLDHWGISEGRIAHIGFVDDTGAMKIMDLPQAKGIGESNYYAKSLSLEEIKEVYREVQQERFEKQALQKVMKNRQNAVR